MNHISDIDTLTLWPRDGIYIRGYYCEPGKPVEVTHQYDIGHIGADLSPQNYLRADYVVAGETTRCIAAGSGFKQGVSEKEADAFLAEVAAKAVEKKVKHKKHKE